MRLRWFALSLVLAALFAQGASAALRANGRVVDMKGRVVANAPVYAVLLCYDVTGEKASLKARTVTDSRGRFAFRDLPQPDGKAQSWVYEMVAFRPGSYFGWVHGQGALRSGPGTTKSPTAGYKLAVAGFTTFHGQVVDKQGQPIAGARATIGSLVDKFGPSG